MMQNSFSLSRRTSIFFSPKQTSLTSRLSAKAIDMLVTMALYFSLAVISRGLGILVCLVFVLFQDALGSGQSTGKKIIGLRVIDDMSGVSCSFEDSFLRNLPFALCFLFFLFQSLWALCVVFTLPILLLETYLIITLDSGIRIGDILGNTLVIESFDENFEPR